MKILRPFAFLLSLIVAAAAPRPAAAEPGVVRSGPAACHGLALTFDLCPVSKGRGFDETLIHELIADRIHATFFPSGAWIEKHDADLRELLAVPFFEIGTHGGAHVSLPKLSLDAQERDMLVPVHLLASEYGRKAVLFRPPYGDYDAQTIKAAHDDGLVFVLWSVVSGDPDPHLPAVRIEQEVERRARPGSIVIFHANGRGWHTADVVADVYRRLITGKGMTSMTVSELLAGCAPASRSGR
jgi:peptidoglycan/xylan/chitin deacetylase (PgdA/CDA1 family)